MSHEEFYAFLGVFVMIQIAIFAAWWKMLRALLQDLERMIGELREDLAKRTEKLWREKMDVDVCKEKERVLTGKIRGLEENFWAHRHEDGTIVVKK